MLKFFTRKPVHVPTDAKETLEGVQLWDVRWKSYHHTNDYSLYAHEREELMSFTSEEDALKFQTALSEAMTLLRYSGKVLTKVEVRKQP